MLLLQGRINAIFSSVLVFSFFTVLCGTSGRDVSPNKIAAFQAYQRAGHNPEIARMKVGILAQYIMRTRQQSTRFPSRDRVEAFIKASLEAAPLNPHTVAILDAVENLRVFGQW